MPDFTKIATKIDLLLEKFHEKLQRSLFYFVIFQNTKISFSTIIKSQPNKV